MTPKGKLTEKTRVRVKSEEAAAGLAGFCGVKYEGGGKVARTLKQALT